MSALDVTGAQTMCSASSDSFMSGEWCEAANILSGRVQELEEALREIAKPRHVYGGGDFEEAQEIAREVLERTGE